MVGQAERDGQPTFSYGDSSVRLHRKREGYRSGAVQQTFFGLTPIDSSVST
jgi:hypothetical protein